jgi:hypothetical protein
MPAQLHFGAGDSAAFGTSGTTTSAITGFSKSALSNMTVGDLLVAWIHNQSSSVGATITPPGGWVQYGALPGSPSNSASRLSSIYYYPVTSQNDIDSLPTTISWSFSVAARVACVVARASGIDLDNIEDSEAASFSSATSASSFNIAEITTINATSLLVGASFHQNSASTSAPSTTSFLTSFQEYRTSTSDPTIANTGAALGYSYLTSAGATGNQTVSLDNTSAALAGELVAFRAGTWTPPAPVTRPTVVGTPTTVVSQTATTSFTINKPSGIIDEDVLILALSAQTPTATVDFTCSGWSRISQAFVSSSADHRVTAFYALTVPDSAALTVSDFTFTSTDSASGGRIAAEMFIVRGADINDLVDAVSPYGSNSSGSQTTTVAPGTSTVNNALLLTTFNAQFVSGVDYTVGSGPNGMTLQQDLVTSTGAVSKTRLVVYQADVEAGAIGSKILTWAGAQSQSSGVSIVIKPLTPPDGRPVKYTSAVDTLSDGRLYYTSAVDTLATPSEVRPFPDGYPSVTTMLAQSPFYIGHRGGSDNWPEMSLHAYTQAGFWGVSALELSVHRTSDGIWFGLHDATLDRTSGTTGFTASAHTWSEVQAYLITAAETDDPGQAARPYARWEEIMDAYYNSHVFFIDPKSAGTTHRAELLDMMDAMPGTPTDRFVCKFYGVSGNVGNTNGWAFEAAQRGYASWGYFYQADAANFTTYQGRWDILGMDYNADGATWTSILSYGKPVIGHTIDSSAAATSALSKGADGLMVAAVTSVIPRSA